MTNEKVSVEIKQPQYEVVTTIPLMEAYTFSEEEKEILKDIQKHGIEPMQRIVAQLPNSKVEDAQTKYQMALHLRIQHLVFPAELIPSWFWSMYQKALEYETPLSIGNGVSLPQYISIRSEAEPHYDLFGMFMRIRLIYSKSQAQLGLDFENYTNLLFNLDQMLNIQLAMTQPHKITAARETEVKMRILVPKN